VRRLAAFLHLDVMKFIGSYCYFLKTRILQDKKEVFQTWELCLQKNDKGCLFLDDKLCGVQDVKPFTCRAFPFLGNIEYIKLCTEEQSYCEGFGRGKSYSEKQVHSELSKNRQAFLHEKSELIACGMDIRKVFDLWPADFAEEEIPDHKALLF
jgi:Fe-S-cluster containining protein